MKKILFIVLTSVLALAFTSCNKDDDNGPAFDANGKRLVSKIICQGEDDMEEITLNYTPEGRVCQSTYRYTYEENGETYTDEEITYYSVKDNVLTLKYECKYKYLEYDGYYKGTANFQLNEDGYAVSGRDILEEFDEDGELYHRQESNYSYEYDEDRYLKQEINDGLSIHYSHDAQGDYIKSSYGNYAYYDKENKANIDFYAFCCVTVAGEDGLGLNALGWLGKPNKHLLKTHQEDNDTVTYKYDSEGYVTSFTSERFGTYIVTYN